MIENQLRFKRESRRDSEKLGGEGEAAQAGGGSCGSGGRGGRDGITPDSLTRQLPTTPKGKRGGIAPDPPKGD